MRKGEKASTVVKYGAIERENDQGEDKKIPYTKAYRVFNADQIEDLPEEFYRQPEPPRDLGTQADPALDSFFAAFGVPIDTTDKPQAYYNPNSDRIHMPPITTFYEAVEYYGTLAHEAKLILVRNCQPSHVAFWRAGMSKTENQRPLSSADPVGFRATSRRKPPIDRQCKK